MASVLHVLSFFFLFLLPLSLVHAQVHFGLPFVSDQVIDLGSDAAETAVRLLEYIALRPYGVFSNVNAPSFSSILRSAAKVSARSYMSLYFHDLQPGRA